MTGTMAEGHLTGFITSMTARGHTLNPCPDCCQDKGVEHVHLHSPDGRDGIVWADGRVSEWDLTQPARLVYPTCGVGARPAYSAWSGRTYAPPSLPKECYQMPGGAMVHVRPGCRCK